MPIPVLPHIRVSAKAEGAQPNFCSCDSSLTGVRAENKNPDQTIL